MLSECYWKRMRILCHITSSYRHKVDWSPIEILRIKLWHKHKTYTSLLCEAAEENNWICIDRYGKVHQVYFFQDLPWANIKSNRAIKNSTKEFFWFHEKEYNINKINHVWSMMWLWNKKQYCFFIANNLGKKRMYSNFMVIK